jgi:hypothetical protein
MRLREHPGREGREGIASRETGEETLRGEESLVSLLVSLVISLPLLSPSSLLFAVLIYPLDYAV